MSLRQDAGDYGVHPALLDAALHAVLVAGLANDGSDALWLPFSWSEVTQYATGATELRVRFLRVASGDDTRTVSLLATDGSGRLVLRAQALRLRQATFEQRERASEGEARDLYYVDTRPVTLHDVAARAHVIGRSGRLSELLGAPRHSDVRELSASLDGEVPALVVIDLTRERDEPAPGEAAEEASSFPRSVREATAAALRNLQILLTEPRLSATSLLWVTQRASASHAADEAPLDLRNAPLWGFDPQRPQRAPRALTAPDRSRA